MTQGLRFSLRHYFAFIFMISLYLAVCHDFESMDFFAPVLPMVMILYRLYQVRSGSGRCS
jgi:hypothetical protein